MSSAIDSTMTAPVGLDPQQIHFTPQVIKHCARVGFSINQLHAALREPRLINEVRAEPTPRQHHRPRRRYCGAGVAVIVEGRMAVAVIKDDPLRFPARVA